MIVIVLCFTGAMLFIVYNNLELKSFSRTSTESDVSLEVVVIDIACQKRAAVWSLKYLCFTTIVQV